MSRRAKAAVSPDRIHAAVFAALGDRTRLRLVGTLAGGEPRSIAELTAGFALTRQAVTKHLRVLESAGLVQSTRQGREAHFTFVPQPLDDARSYLSEVSQQWDAALGRLKAWVESDPDGAKADQT